MTVNVFQLDGANRSTLKSLASLKFFFQRPNLKRGPGQNWLTSRPYTGIVTDENQRWQLLSMKQKFVDVSLSFLLYLYGHSLSWQLIVSVHFFFFFKIFFFFFIEMDDAKKRALIKAQAAKKKESGNMGLSAIVAINLSTKRKTAPKSDRQVKKSKVSLEPVVGLMAEGKTVIPMKHGSGKGFMKAPSNLLEKPPVLLREDSKHALEQISSFIYVKDYRDLGNHSTEAMRESGLFAVA